MHIKCKIQMGSFINMHTSRVISYETDYIPYLQVNNVTTTVTREGGNEKTYSGYNPISAYSFQLQPLVWKKGNGAQKYETNGYVDILRGNPSKTNATSSSASMPPTC